MNNKECEYNEICSYKNQCLDDCTNCKHHKHYKVDGIAHHMLCNYDKYREHNQILANYLMYRFQNWNVFINEKSQDHFEFIFYNKEDNNNDVTIVLSREQIEHFHNTIHEYIIPILKRFNKYVDLEEQI